MQKKTDILKIIQWALALIVLAFGAYMSWGGKVKWLLIGMGVHALPLAALLLPWPMLRVWLLWFGVFLILQDGYSLYDAKADLYKTLPAGMHDTFNVTGDLLRGIQGSQTVTTDDHGYRITAPVDYSDDKPYRIFAIGASTTEQIYLDDYKTWTHRMQEGLGESVQVVNTGLSGLRAEHHLATLKHILPYHPDMVIFLIGVNDWNKQVREHFGSHDYEENKFRDSLTVAAIRGSIQKMRRAAKKKIAPPQETTEGVRIEDGSYYKDKMGSLTNRKDVRPWVPGSVDPAYARAMEKIAAICKREKFPCVFLTQPHGYAEDISDDYKSHFWMTPPGEKYTLNLSSLIGTAKVYNDYMKSFACGHGLYFVDLARDIPAGFESFYDDVHFNESGASAVAADLIPAIEKIIDGADPAENCR